MSLVDSPPLATGRVVEPSRSGHVVLALRAAWHLAYELGNEIETVSKVEIAEAFGGHSPQTVSPWLRSLKKFEATYPNLYGKWGGVPRLMLELELAVNQELE